MPVKRILKLVLPHKLRLLIRSCFDRSLLGMFALVPERTRLYISMHSQLVLPLDYKRAPIVLSIKSEIEYWTRLNSCKKEPETVAWIEEEFKPGEVFYDIGANVGAYSLVAAKFHEGRVKTYAFEPSYSNYAQLCQNLLLNKCGDSVSPIALALSDKSGMETFNYHKVDAGGALNALGAAVNQQGMPFKPDFQHFVLSLTLSHFVEYFGAPMPHHIKIDVDGIEMSVLRGISKILAGGGVSTLLVETSTVGIEKEVVDFLREHGYAMDSRHAKRRGESANLIFRPTV